jgi:hypothetical protein
MRPVTPAKAVIHSEMNSRSPAFAEDKLRGNGAIFGFDAAERATPRALSPPLLNREQGLSRSNPGSIPEAANE